MTNSTEDFTAGIILGMIGGIRCRTYCWIDLV